MRPKARYSSGGVAKIRRDNYGPKWYSTVNTVQTRDQHKCLACGAVGGTKRPDGTSVKLDTHHIRRITRGGTTTKANLLTICDNCHKRRHSHL